MIPRSFITNLDPSIILLGKSVELLTKQAELETIPTDIRSILCKSFNEEETSIFVFAPIQSTKVVLIPQIQPVSIAPIQSTSVELAPIQSVSIECKFKSAVLLPLIAIPRASQLSVPSNSSFQAELEDNNICDRAEVEKGFFIPKIGPNDEIMNDKQQ